MVSRESVKQVSEREVGMLDMIKICTPGIANLGFHQEPEIPNCVLFPLVLSSDLIWVLVVDLVGEDENECL